jgi:peptidoglycan/LPS O-acetylase OafA/YrhL
MQAYEIGSHTDADLMPEMPMIVTPAKPIIRGFAGAAPTRTTPRAIATSGFLGIQALRAIAALLVVVYHAFDMWEVRINGAPGLTWTNGAAGVDIFFVISGFVMVVSSRRLLSQPYAAMTFMQHRIVRIVPLYWLLTTLKLALVFFFADLALRSNLDLDYVVRSYLFFPVVDGAGHFRPLVPVGWTLTYEFLFYALFAVALGMRVDVLRILIPAFAFFVMLALMRTESWPAWTILFSTIVIEFLFGVALAKLTLRGWSLPPALAASAMLAGVALILIIPEGPENLRTLVWGVPALAIVAGAASLEKRIAGVLPRWLLALGDASYSIYLVHGFVLPVVGLGIIALHWTSMTAQAFTVAGCLIAGSLAGWLVYVLIERPILLRMKRPTANKSAPRIKLPA